MPRKSKAKVTSNRKPRNNAIVKLAAEVRDLIVKVSADVRDLIGRVEELEAKSTTPPRKPISGYVVVYRTPDGSFYTLGYAYTHREEAEKVIRRIGNNAVACVKFTEGQFDVDNG